MAQRTILTLSEEARKQADRWALELRVSRAEFIRRAVSAYAGELEKKKEEDAIRRER